MNKRASQGFTIVELIIVVIVIGIIASLAIISYGSWRTNVAEKQAKSDLTQVSAAMESARGFGTVGYPTSIPSTFTASSGITMTYRFGDKTYYCIDAVSASISSVTFHIDSRSAINPLTGVC